MAGKVGESKSRILLAVGIMTRSRADLSVDEPICLRLQVLGGKERFFSGKALVNLRHKHLIITKVSRLWLIETLWRRAR